MGFEFSLAFMSIGEKTFVLTVSLGLFWFLITALNILLVIPLSIEIWFVSPPQSH